MAEVIAEIIWKSKRCLKNLQIDMGKEFYNVDVQRFLKKHNINHYSTYSVMKASVFERFNRILKNNMWKMFILHGNYKWIKALSQLVSDYNAHKHRCATLSPRSLKNFWPRYTSNVKIAGPAKFKIDDSVRVNKYKTVFERGYIPNWTTNWRYLKSLKCSILIP